MATSVSTDTLPRATAPDVDPPPARRSWRLRLRAFDPKVERAARRLVVVTLLLPLIVLLARVSPRLREAPLTLGYGMLVLATTVALFYIAYTRYEDPSDPLSEPVRKPAGVPPLPAVPRVSVLLAVKDELEVIETCVRSILGSEWPDLELIVVDDASTDGTLHVLRGLETTLGFRLIALDRNGGKKHALVRGAREAAGDVLAFTDSDCVLAPDALRRCVAALVRNPGLGAVSGHARALNADATVLTRIQDSWYEGQFRVIKAAEATFGSVTCVSGPLAVFRRDAVYNYLPAWTEDRFLGTPFRFATDRQLTGYVLGQRWTGRRLKARYPDSPFVAGVDHPERAWRIGYVRSAVVHTAVPARMRPFLRQQVRWKKSFIRNLFFTGSFVWRRGVGAASLYYGHALFVFAAPFMAVRHLVWAPLHGLWMLTALYLAGVLLKGVAWAFAYRIDHPGSLRWLYRPLMSLLGSLVLSWLLPYSLVTIRRGTWSRSAT